VRLGLDSLLQLCEAQKVHIGKLLRIVSVGTLGQNEGLEGVVVGGIALRGWRCVVAVLVSIDRVNMGTAYLDVP
jgi:hypothetical protein